MNAQTEMEIRAQAMINTLGQQRTTAFDQIVYAQAELAIKDAKIKELEDEVARLTPEPIADIAPE